MRFLVFFLVASGILAVAYGYVGWRLIVPAHLNAPWNGLAWAMVVLLYALPLIPFFLWRMGMENRWVDWASWAGYLAMGFFSLTFVLVLARDVLWIGAIGSAKLGSLITRLADTQGTGTNSCDSERRRFLLHSTNLGIIGVSAALAGYGLYEARRRPSVVRLTVPFPSLPVDLDGFRIAQFTDVHIGPTVKRDWMQAVVDQTNALGADLIAFTGDLVDGSVPHLRDDVAPIAQLTAPHGVYFVTGNHEYYSGALPWVEEVKRLGLTVLNNEHRVLTRGSGAILLAGVTDYTAGQFVAAHATDPHAAMSGAPPCDLKILLAHQPRSIFAAAKAGYDLQLSGHTHGGQFFPWNFVAALAQPYIEGLHKHANTWIYVSRGTGYWGPPLRLGKPSEVTLITLTRA